MTVFTLTVHFRLEFTKNFLSDLNYLLKNFNMPAAHGSVLHVCIYTWAVYGDNHSPPDACFMTLRPVIFSFIVSKYSHRLFVISGYW